ncbi:MAG TPA: hypothetical protein VIY47_14865 [Ignavibacteriaceae bacterium]
MEDKRTNLIVTLKPDFHKHLKDAAKKKRATLSAYVRAALTKVSGFKEKDLV